MLSGALTFPGKIYVLRLHKYRTTTRDRTPISHVDESILDKWSRSASHASENADRTVDSPTYSPSAWAMITCGLSVLRSALITGAGDRTGLRSKASRRSNADKPEKIWAEGRHCRRVIGRVGDWPGRDDTFLKSG
jgi:hypothetical protein